MDFEIDARSAPEEEEEEVVENDETVDVALTDVIPCNLMRTCKFLASRVEVALSIRNLRLFLRCYGFLMYDKREKLSAFRRNADASVREVADILEECSTLADFKISISEHLKHVRNIIAEPDTLNALVDNDETCPRKKAEQQRSGLRILELAKKSLEYVFAFIQNSDHLRRSLNANEYCRRHLLLRNSIDTPVYDAWHRSTECNFHKCLSVVFRDFVVTTGLQTQTTLLFVIRVSLMLTYLIANFMRRRENSSSVPRITVVLPTDMDAESYATAHDYWTNCNSVTVEKFVATTMIAMSRMYIAECLHWPARIEHSEVPLSRIVTSADRIHD